jgi:hypothetical protein
MLANLLLSAYTHLYVKLYILYLSCSEHNEIPGYEALTNGRLSFDKFL